MAFSSVEFLFLFFPLFFGIYWVLPEAARNGWAVMGSVLFYSWGAPTFLPLLALSLCIDHIVALKLARATNERARRGLLASCISLNVGILVYFKYSNFLAAQYNMLARESGLPGLHWSEVLLPIGISFVTFEKISYLTDVYRRIVPPARSLTEYFLFIFLFPHLIAGPIFRYHDLSPQFPSHPIDAELLSTGFVRLVTGLAKKTLLADPMGHFVDQLFALPPHTLTPLLAWGAVVGYAFQIYFDFSGYSDMAIGLGRLLGFRFKENFNQPYIAESITDFWRRWHISLSSWMREYLYIPLGGNRGSPVRTAMNMWIVFLISGFWHGASWNFLLWGAYHGGWLSLERTRWWQRTVRLPRPMRVALNFIVVCIGWVVFRATSLAQAGHFLQEMSIVFAGTVHPLGPRPSEYFTRKVLTVGTLCVVLSFIIPSFAKGAERYEPARVRGPIGRTAQVAGAVGLLFLAAATLVNSTFHPFIYFRF